MSAEQITDKQLCWEYIKYEENFLFPFPKKMPKKTHAQIATLKNELKEYFWLQLLDYKTNLSNMKKRLMMLRSNDAKDVSASGTSLEKNLQNFSLT